MDSSGWLDRNSEHPMSRKRDRRSYDNNWSSYEARGRQSGGSGNGGGLAQFGGGGGGIDRNNITAQGERVGVPHNPYNNGTASGGGGTSNYGRRGNTAGAVSNYGGGNTNPYSRSTASNNNNAAGSRMRVADYRGAAARIGNLPANQPQGDVRGGIGPGVGRSNNNNNNNNAKGMCSLFQNPDFLQSLRNPPPITVNLPEDLRSALCEEQCTVVESVLSGHSTFFTGPAGSGKSHVLSTLLKANELGVGGKNGKPRKIVVTATTGVAACNVGGITIHSFGGCGNGSSSAAEIAKRVMGNEYSKGRWREVDVLVIDEISMMAGAFLDKLSFIASRARNDRRPFGGVQLVVCGDFFQLPPVDLAKEGFAFESKCWPEVIKCSVLLKQVFRQRGDTALMNILDEARIGELSRESADKLRRHGTLPAASRTFGGDNDKEKIIPTLLECKNRQVDKANELEMAKLSGEVYTFHSRDRALTETYKRNLNHCQAPAQLDLKVGAQVMLLKNIDLEKGLANGSRGVVVRFQRPKNESELPKGFKKMEFPVVRFDSVKAVGKEKGDEDSAEDDDNEFTIHPEEWSNKMGDETVSCRVQIPLRLAWSISVHKSQGMTIPNLTVNLQGVFEYGQAYVALSRATELRLLTLRGFTEKSFKAHPKVKSFYKLLDSGGEPIFGQANEKENSTQRQDDLGDLRDPFEGNSGPISQHKQAPPPYANNYYQQYQRQQPVQTTGRFSPMNSSAQRSTPTSTNSVSPKVTEEQRKRMEENRKRALAKRARAMNS